jgi:trehalose 6-phosphate phosphatase
MTRPALSGHATDAGRTSAALDAPATDCAYFFDIDGTIVDIAGTPDRVQLDQEIRRLIAELHRSAGGAVALISGRAIADIDRLFPDTGMPAAGQHGVERRDAGGRVSRHAFPSALLPWARQRLAQAEARHPGLLLEDKGLSLALHYRLAPSLAGYAHRFMRSVQAKLGDDFCLQAGKCVVEVKPAGRDKGMAVAEFMHEAPFRGRIPVFVGDDLTDEYGFTTVNELGGHSVKVGPGRTVARWRLPDVRAVHTWLERGVGAADVGRVARVEVRP